MRNLLSVYMDPEVANAWRASVKALGMKQAEALEEALQEWMQRRRADIDAAMKPTLNYTAVKRRAVGG